MAKIPTPEEYRQAWSSMAWAERREIMRSVNRGEAMRLRKKARLAVAAARQQQRYWKWAWLLAPLVSLIQAPNWPAVAASAVILTILTGGLSLFRYRRAGRAERANLERLQR